MEQNDKTVGIKEEPNILEAMEVGDTLSLVEGTAEHREAKRLLPGYRYKAKTFGARKIGKNLIVVRVDDKVVSNDYSMKLFQCSSNAYKYLEGEYLTGKVDIDEPLGAKFPLHLMLVGQSFSLPLVNAKYKRFNIETEIRKYNHISGKKFRVIEHSKLNLYEVVRVA